MYTVKHLLEAKTAQVWSVAPEVTAYQALELMAAKDIGALVVLANGKLQGVFSERDYARKVILKGRSSKTTSVGELMSTDVPCVRPDDTIEDCMNAMTGRRTRHLPVIANDQVIGVVSIGDVVKAIISDRELTIQQLERYITGGHTTVP